MVWVYGKVFDADTKNPIVGAEVCVGTECTISGSDGSYWVDVEPYHSYIVTAKKEGYKDFVTGIEVWDKAVVYDIYMVKEEVTKHRIYGYVKDETGRGIQSAKVSWMGDYVYTNVNGYYYIPNPETGSGKITAEKSGYYTGEKYITYRGGELEVNFTLTKIPEEIKVKDHWISSVAGDWEKRHLKDDFMVGETVYYHLYVTNVRKGDVIGFVLYRYNVYNGKGVTIRLSKVDYTSQTDGGLIICWGISLKDVGDFRIYPHIKNVVQSTYKSFSRKKCRRAYTRIKIKFEVEADRSGTVPGVVELIRDGNVAYKMNINVNVKQGRHWYETGTIDFMLKGIPTGNYSVRVRLFGKEESSLRLLNTLTVIE